MITGNSTLTDPLTTFRCCCSITQTEFDSTGIAGILVFNIFFQSLTCITTTAGNVLVLLAILRTPALHSPSNILLFCLAVSDLGVGSIVQPIFVVYNVAKLKRMARVFCNAAASLKITGYVLCFASLFTITAISLDMYLALRLHLRYNVIVTVRRMSGIVVAIWLCSAVVTAAYSAFRENTWFLSIAIIVLCPLVTTFAYYRVFKIVHRHQAQIHVQQRLRDENAENNAATLARQKKALISRFLIYCVLVICYLPYVVLTIVKLSSRFNSTQQALLELSYVLLFVNSTLNPFIYCWRIPAIRTAVFDTAKKMFTLVR